MEGLVEQVHARWGSWEEFARTVGMDHDVIARLRDSLLAAE
jgi:hypothetical protein